MLEYRSFKFLKKSKNFDKISPVWLIDKRLKDQKGFLEDNFFPDSSKGKFIIGNKKSQILTEICKLIKEANEIICLSTFIMQKNEIVKELLIAANRGVRVYIITNLSLKLDQIPEDNNDENKQSRREEAQELMIELSNSCLVRQGDFHAKFILIDPKSKPKGIISTANFTNAALSKNPELAIKLDPREVSELFQIFKFVFWNHSESEIKGSNRYGIGYSNGNNVGKDENLDHLTKVFTTAIRSVDDSLEELKNNNQLSLKDNIINLLENSEEIFAAAYDFKEDNEVFNILKKKIHEKIPTTILVRPEKYVAMNVLMDFAELENVSIKGVPMLHAKYLIVKKSNGYQGILMTSNFTKLGLEQGFDIGIKVRDGDCWNLKEINDIWYKNAPFSLKKEISIQSTTGTIGFLNKKDFVEKTIENQKKLESEMIDIENRLWKISNIESWEKSLMKERYTIPNKMDSNKIIYKEILKEFQINIPKIPTNMKKYKVSDVLQNLRRLSLQLSKEKENLIQKIDKLKDEKKAIGMKKSDNKKIKEIDKKIKELTKNLNNKNNLLKENEHLFNQFSKFKKIINYFYATKDKEIKKLKIINIVEHNIEKIVQLWKLNGQLEIKIAIFE